MERSREHGLEESHEFAIFVRCIEYVDGSFRRVDAGMLQIVPIHTHFVMRVDPVL